MSKGKGQKQCADCKSFVIARTYICKCGYNFYKKYNQSDFRQEIFWKIKNHLLTQNKRCSDTGLEKCRLRFESLKCAASILIPDNDYSKELEDSSFYKFFTDSGYSESEKSLIEELQLIHDYEEVIKWPQRLQKIATDFNLRYEQI